MGAGLPGKKDFLDLGGGLSQLPASKLADNEMSVLVNFFTRKYSLATRDGLTRVHSDAAPSNVTSFSPLLTSDDRYSLIVGMTDGIGRLDGNTIIPHSISDGRVYTASDAPWVFKQFRNTLLACRLNSGTLKSVGHTAFRDAGITAPATAPTLSEGAAGDIGDGDYYGVVTFYNTVTGAESNPSPVSAVAAIGASKKINWTNIPVSGNPNVNARRIYRTYVDAVGEYFRVDTIPNNVDTAYTGDNVLPADLDNRAEFTNGLPPATVIWLEIWNERSWLTDGSLVYPSEYGRPESFAEGNYYPFYVDDGHPITVLKAYGDRLVVAKTNGVHFLLSDGGSGFVAQTLTDKHGCVSPHSMQVAEGLLFWFAGDNFYRSAGDDAQSISTQEGAARIRDIIAAIPQDQWDLVRGAIYPHESWYVVTVPQGSSTTAQKTLIYNYKTGTWQVFEHAYPALAPSFIASVFDADGLDWMYCCFPSHAYIYKWFDGTLDYQTEYDCEFVMGAQQFGSPGLRSGVSRVHMNLNEVAQNATISLYKDGESTASKSRTVSLYGADGWRTYALSGLHPLAKETQFGFVTSGKNRVVVDGIAIEYAAFARRGRIM